MKYNKIVIFVSVAAYLLLSYCKPNMIVYPSTVALVAASLSLQASVSFGFVPSSTSHTVSSTNIDGVKIILNRPSNIHQQQHILYSTATEDSESASTATKTKKKLGLITFDLGEYLLCIRYGT